jgi:hypothetical protein
MSEKLTFFPYINGIGVLSYNIQTKQKNPPEFYQVDEPMIEYSDDDFFTANGWVYGYENIYGSVQTVSTTDGFSKTLTENTKNPDILVGTIFCPLYVNFSDYAGALSGDVIGDPIKLTFTGNLPGTLLNLKTNTVILMQRICKWDT